MDGVEFIRTIRGLGSDVPIIVVSGSLDSDPLPSDVAQEVWAALPKPVFTQQLRAAVKFAIERNEQHHRMIRRESSAAAA